MSGAALRIWVSKRATLDIKGATSDSTSGDRAETESGAWETRDYGSKWRKVAARVIDPSPPARMQMRRVC